jgi:iduronate 2-sulfatase
MPMRVFFCLFLLTHAVRAAGQTPNVLLICIDDLRPELGSFGADYIDSPHIDRLAESGRAFRRHYVQAPTCGASRFTLLTGRYDRQQGSNHALFRRARNLADPPASPSLPRHFRNHGYTTVALGKVSHHPGGLGGPDWDDPDKPELPGAWTRTRQPTGPWKHPRGVMHGLARGEIRQKAGEMDVFQAAEGPDSIYPDGLTTDAALGEMETLADGEKPFFLAVGLIRPHLPFGAPQRYLDRYADTELPPIPHPEKPVQPTTWHRSHEFMKYNRWERDPNEDAAFATEVRRHYAACVSYADAQVGRLLDRLDELGLTENTTVVLWGDHGWHLGEHAVWGKHTLYEESLRSPLIIRHPGMEKPGEPSDAVVETIDLFPTLCRLADLPVPPTLDGRDLLPQLTDPKAPGHAAVSYHAKARTLRTDSHRLIVHPKGLLELYDHRQSGSETRNLAAKEPELAKKLSARLQAKLAP